MVSIISSAGILGRFHFLEHELWYFSLVFAFVFLVSACARSLLKEVLGVVVEWVFALPGLPVDPVRPTRWRRWCRQEPSPPISCSLGNDVERADRDLYGAESRAVVLKAYA